MRLVLDLFLIGCLLVIVIQDFKHRAISWYVLPIILLGFIFKSYFSNGFQELLKFSAFNISFIIVQIIFLTTYMSIKNKKITNIIDSYIGLGDVLFFVVMCLAFSPANFIVFYISSITFTLVGFLIYKQIVKNASVEIPLAGAQALAMIVLLVMSNFTQLNFYSDDYLLSRIA